MVAFLGSLKNFSSGFPIYTICDVQSTITTRLIKYLLYLRLEVLKIVENTMLH